MPNLISNHLKKIIFEDVNEDKPIDVLWVGRLCDAKGVRKIPSVLHWMGNFFAKEIIRVHIIGHWYNDCKDF